MVQFIAETKLRRIIRGGSPSKNRALLLLTIVHLVNVFKPFPDGLNLRSRNNSLLDFAAEYVT